VPDVAEELNRVQQARARISSRVTHLIGTEIDRIEQLRSRPVLANPSWLIDTRAEELTRYVARGTELMSRLLERGGNRIAELTGHLRALSPKRTLERGYAIAQLPSGAALRSTRDAPEGTRLLLTVADGKITTIASRAAAEDSDGR
jgi:exodeoxyribonuclease VII large subunit